MLGYGVRFRFLAFLLFSSFPSILFAQTVVNTAGWNPHAGEAANWTQGATFSFSSSSGTGATNANAYDGNLNTAWNSDGCLPYGFIKREDLNPLKNLCANGGCTATTNSNTVLNTITDTLDNSGQVTIPVVNGEARLTLQLAAAQTLQLVNFRGSITGGNTNPITLTLVTQTGAEEVIGTYTTTNNYNHVRFTATTSTITAIKFTSTQPFNVFEIAALKAPCYEWYQADFGQVRELGWIRIKPYSPDVTRLALEASADGQVWTEVAEVVPSSVAFNDVQINPPVQARYLRAKGVLIQENYRKMYGWELNAYDRYGLYGPKPPVAVNPHTLRDLIGVNGIWGWGHNKFSDSIAQGSGPSLFARMSSYARNYHNLKWDVRDPDTMPDYTKMANGGGTDAQWWLNWNREYAAWNANGLPVQASIQFSNSNTPASTWDTPYQSAYNYGYAFARHFGPSYGTGHVRIMEVGNEPWDYESSFMQTILSGMAAGAKAADPAMKVMPAAYQTMDRYAGAYLADVLTAADAPNIDMLNIHTYSHIFLPSGERVATHPENPAGGLHSVLAMIRWRNHNMPNTPIYLSEWGWDSTGGGEACTDGECVTEREQAVYGVRGALMLARYGLDRLTWYFYGNVNNTNSTTCTTLYCRSGLVASAAGNHALKDSFRAFVALITRLGSQHFVSTLREDNTAWVYLMGQADGTPTHLVAWRPRNGNDLSTTAIGFTLNYKAGDTWRIDGSTETGTIQAAPSVVGNSWTMDLGTAPTVVTLLPPDPLAIDTPPSVSRLTGGITLHQLAPLPLVSNTTLTFTSAFKQKVVVKLFDTLGRQVQTLFEGNVMENETKSLTLEAKGFVSGVYVVVIEAESGRLTKKLVRIAP